MHGQHGEVPGHRTGVPEVHAFAAPPQLQAQPVPGGPALQVAHGHRRAHLRDGRRCEYRGRRIGQARRPLRQVGDGGPELPGRRHRARVVPRLLAQRAVPRVHDVPAGERFGRVVAGAAHVQRLQQPLADLGPPGLAGDPLGHRAEQAVGEVRVVECVVRRVRGRVGCQLGEQVVRVDARRALPPVALGLALQPADVREQLADRDAADGGTGKVPVQQVVEGQPVLVAQLEDQGGGERLGDRTDPVLRAGVRYRYLAGAADVHQRAVPDDPGDQRRYPAGRLRRRDQLVDPADGLRQHGRSPPVCGARRRNPIR